MLRNRSGGRLSRAGTSGRLAPLVFVILVIVAGCSGSLGPEVVVGEVAFQVELAVTPAERQQGLSGRERLASREGMLFVYGEPRVLSFWMREMLFPLDFVWIGSECTVVDITPEVPIPPPGAALGGLPTYSPSSPASYNLEIGAGEADRAGLALGDPVRFVGIVAEGADC